MLRRDVSLGVPPASVTRLNTLCTNSVQLHLSKALDGQATTPKFSTLYMGVNQFEWLQYKSV